MTAALSGARFWKRRMRLVPRTMAGRSVAVVLLAIFLVQLVSWLAFFDRHWEYMTHQSSESMVFRLRSATVLFDTLNLPNAQKAQKVWQETGLWVDFYEGPSKVFPEATAPKRYAFQSRFERALRRHMPFPHRFVMEKTGTRVWVQARDGWLLFVFPTKWLLNKTGLLWFLWSIGGMLFFGLVAVVLIRRQIRPLRLLMRLAVRMKRGDADLVYKPSGTTEVYRIGKTLYDTYQKLLQKNEEQQVMLLGVSHDLGTVLTRIRLQLSLMTGPEVAGLKGDVTGMGRMLESYAHFLETGRIEDAARVEVLGILMHVLKGLPKNDVVRISLSVPKGFMVNLPPVSMKRCLENIIWNAVTYAKSTVQVMLRSEETLPGQDPSFLITVADDGPGIDPGHYNDVFKPFVRLENARGLKGSETGLGLAIVKNLTHKMGGEAWVEPSDLGGACFCLALPVKAAPNTP